MVDDLNILKQSQLRWLNWDIIFQMVNGDCFDHGKYMSQLFAIIPRHKKKKQKNVTVPRTLAPLPVKGQFVARNGLRVQAVQQPPKE